ncbi:NAD-P-binding protein [Pilatotrama ljubarskyi]|nr:NAD-P-binding protein [Pilatotrama ljubarskyi]
MSQPRVWLITGTSTGLGRALAELVLEKGEAVIATARKPSVLDDLAQKYPKDRLLLLKLDVTVREHIVDAFAQAKKAFGRIDVVFNNAGYADTGEVESMDEATARAIFDTNFWGATAVTREALEFFREVNPPGHGGVLLQMSSVLGVTGTPAFAFYSASKFALEGMTDSLVKELDAQWNIKVTLIELGWFRSQCVPNAQWSTPHPAYTNPDLATNQLRAGWPESVAAGDTRKAVEVFFKIAGLPDPPLHFPVGKDALLAIRKKTAERIEVMDQYESWSEDLLAAD